MKREYPFIDTVDKLQEEIDRVKKAQAVYAGFTQEQVDRIFLAAATAANKARIPLAKAAVAETGMGIVEDKVIKNHFASEYIYNAYRNTKTCGVIEEDPAEKDDNNGRLEFNMGKHGDTATIHITNVRVEEV